MFCILQACQVLHTAGLSSSAYCRPGPHVYRDTWKDQRGKNPEERGGRRKVLLSMLSPVANLSVICVVGLGAKLIIRPVASIVHLKFQPCSFREDPLVLCIPAIFAAWE